MSERRTECPVCGMTPKPLLGATKDAWICARCEHSFIARLPTDEELAAVYGIYGYDSEVGRYSPPFLDAIIGDLVQSFAPFRQTNNLLDVGFGAGGVLKIAKAEGWNPHGVELSSAAIAYARERDLGTLYEGDFLTLPLPVGTFDVVVMSELVEHLRDPMPFLRRAREVLRPGGLLYMTTPHGRGVSGRALRADWSVLRPPEHLQLFSIDSMRRSLRDAGFQKATIYTQGLLPHELVSKLRARIRGGSRPHASNGGAQFEERAKRSVDFNASLSGRRVGRALKDAANVVLRAASLGDSLRVRAER